MPVLSIRVRAFAHPRSVPRLTVGECWPAPLDRKAADNTGRLRRERAVLGLAATGREELQPGAWPDWGGQEPLRRLEERPYRTGRLPWAERPEHGVERVEREIAKGHNP